VAVVSLPDFDPNNPREAKDPDRINRLTTNVYEMGSTFKAFTLAILPVDSESRLRRRAGPDANVGYIDGYTGTLSFGKWIYFN
jgi:Penicillin binding protein transpeptidase domain